MPINFENTTVTIDGQPYGTLDPDQRTSTRCAWSPAVIRWGYRDTMGDPEPSTAQLRITVPDGQPLPQYGQQVVITSDVRNTPETGGSGALSDQAYPLFLGHIDGATRHRVTLSAPRATPIVQGWAVDLTASGSLAQLSRTMLADNPWPMEWVTDRLDRIRNLLGPDWTLTESGLFVGVTYTVRARDVDNFPAVEAIRRAVALKNYLMVEYTTTQGILFRSIDLANVFARPVAGGQLEVRPSSTVRDVPASMFIDEPRDLDVGSVINSLAVNYETKEGDSWTDRTYVKKAAASIAKYGESQWRSSSDAHMGTIATEAIEQTLDRILQRRSLERWSLAGPLALDLKRWPYSHDGRLAFRTMLPPNLPTSVGGIINILDAPEDIEPQQRVIGGRITLHGDPARQTVEVNLEPPDATLGTQAISIYQVPTTVLINEAQNVTIADAGTVSDVQLY